MKQRESSERHATRVARTTRLTQTKEPRTRRHAHPYDRESWKEELTEALEEWAEDWVNNHSIFED